MEDVEVKPENAPCIANVMIEALAQHDCQQREARDRQEYLRQQDNTASPGAAFPPLQHVEGTKAAPEPSSSSMTSGQSGSTVPLLEKKKITLDEYHHHKAVKQQQTAASVDLDENEERLD